MTAHFTDLSEGQLGFHTDLATGSGNCLIWEKPQNTFCPDQAEYLLLLWAIHSSNHLFAAFMLPWGSPSYLTQVCLMCLKIRTFWSATANRSMKIFCNSKGWNLTQSFDRPYKHTKPLCPSAYHILIKKPKQTMAQNINSWTTRRRLQQGMAMKWTWYFMLLALPQKKSSRLQMHKKSLEAHSLVDNQTWGHKQDMRMTTRTPNQWRIQSSSISSTPWQEVVYNMTE